MPQGLPSLRVVKLQARCVDLVAIMKGKETQVKKFQSDLSIFASQVHPDSEPVKVAWTVNLS